MPSHETLETLRRMLNPAHTEAEFVFHDALFGLQQTLVLKVADGLSDAATVVFTQGHCHSLAMAMHHIYGFPLLYCQDGEEGWHALVQHRKSRMLDIDGSYKLRGGDYCPGMRLKRVGPDFFYDLADEGLAYEPRPFAAAPWALLLGKRFRLTPLDI